MPLHTIVTGIVLVVLGVGAYVLLALTGDTHWTALIPAFPGVILALLGALALARPTWRKHVMHVAVLLAALVAIAGLGDGIRGLADAPGARAITSLLMGVVALAYVALGFKSFRDARRARDAETG